jgi:CheY-like chemotaxis protein
MSQETILIVEDNPVLREGLQEMLELEGFFVQTASNGREALDRMVGQHPDLILSDIAMPEMDGLAFFRRAKRPEWIPIPLPGGEREDVSPADLGAE